MDAQPQPGAVDAEAEPVTHAAGIHTKAPSGVPGLDLCLGGGFDRPGSLLLVSEDLSDKRSFAQGFVAEGLRRGETCLYVDFYRTAAQASEDIMRLRPDGEGHLILLDRSVLCRPGSRTWTPAGNPTNIDEVFAAVRNAVEAARPARVVVDALDYLVDRFPFAAVADFWARVEALEREHGFVLTFLFMNWVYGRSDLENLKALADGVLEFRCDPTAGHRQLLRLDGGRSDFPRTPWFSFALALFGSNGGAAP